MQTRATEELTRALRQRGLRVTPQRVAVLDYLSSTESHPTADEVGRAVNENMPAVSRASVYNVLKSLAGVGLVREVLAGEAITRYDANTDPHHHFWCRVCGGVQDLPWEIAPAPPRAPRGALVERHEMTLQGVCASCVEASPERSAR